MFVTRVCGVCYTSVWCLLHKCVVSYSTLWCFLYDCVVFVAETMHRLLDQCEADQSLHAKQQGLAEVSRVETGRVHHLRLLHHGHDRTQHCHTHDEGWFTISLFFFLIQVFNTSIIQNNVLCFAIV